jgi:hypothetical protein
MSKLGPLVIQVLCHRVARLRAISRVEYAARPSLVRMGSALATRTRLLRHVDTIDGCDTEDGVSIVAYG